MLQENLGISRQTPHFKLVSLPLIFLFLIKRIRDLYLQRDKAGRYSIIQNKCQFIHEKLLLFTAKGKQLWISSTFKIDFLPPLPDLNSKVLLSRKNDNPAVDILGDFDEEFNHDHRSWTSSGGTPCLQFVDSFFSCKFQDSSLFKQIACLLCTYLWNSSQATSRSLYQRGDGSLEREQPQRHVLLLLLKANQLQTCF